MTFEHIGRLGHRQLAQFPFTAEELWAVEPHFGFLKSGRPSNDERAVYIGVIHNITRLYTDIKTKHNLKFDNYNNYISNCNMLG